MKVRLLLVSPLALMLLACAGNDAYVGPTLADVEQQPIELEPTVEFSINRQQVIDSYRELVAIIPGGEKYGKEVQRLADLELEASLDNKLSEDPELALQGEIESRLAIQRYEQYLETYPNREDNDLILYQLSRAYSLETEADKSRRAMDQLVSQFPQSKYIDEIQFRRGENLFVEGQYAMAEAAYGVVVNTHKDSIYYEKALYKYGWTQFKQNQYDEAINSYVKLLDFYQQQQKLEQIKLADGLQRAETELMDDVLRVISLSFSYQPARQPISQFFNRTGKREYEPLLYKKLGELYTSKDRVTDATDIYLSYGENYPFSRYTPVFHGLAIDAYKKAGFSSLLLPEKERYVKTYNKGSAFWAQQTPEDQALLQPMLTGHMSDIATHYHATARVSKKTIDYKKAADWYQLYLDSFPADDKAPEINFLLAESRFDARQFQQAVMEYEKTAYQYPAHKNSAEAGYAALISYNSLYKVSKAENKPSINEQLLQSSLRFSDQFPDDKRMPSVLLNTAEQFFDLKRYPEANDAALRLVQNPTIKPEVKHNAWILIAHSQFELNKFAEAEVAYLNVINGLKPKDKKTRQTMRDQLAASIYKQGEIERQQGNHLLAAGHFLRVGQSVPTSSKRIIAEYDAATEYIAVKDWDNSIKILEGFRKKYPKEKRWRQGVTEKLALAYSNTGRQAKAAGEIMTLVRLSPKSEQQDLLWQAAELYEKSGNNKQAVSIYKTYVKKYPQPLARSIELRYKIAQSYLKQKDSKRYHYWLKEIIKADASGKQQRTARTRYLAATSSIELVKPVHRSFSRIKLTTPLKKSLKRKKNLMKQSIDAYTKAAKYQVEEVTTASTFNIAEIYREFAAALLNSERPKNLNEEELEEYNYLLEDQAYPFEEKAINIHESNLARIPGGTYDDSVKSSLKSLGKLMPFRYAKNEKVDKYVE